MNFDYLYLLSFVFFLICFVSVGYIVVENLKHKGILNINSQGNLYLNMYKFLNYETYLKEKDYFAYEKYEIWRFYLHS